jgi:hypothetical protein
LNREQNRAITGVGGSALTAREAQGRQCAAGLIGVKGGGVEPSQAQAESDEQQ